MHPGPTNFEADDLPLDHHASLSLVKFNKIGKTSMRKIGFAEKRAFSNNCFCK